MLAYFEYGWRTQTFFENIAIISKGLRDIVSTHVKPQKWIIERSVPKRKMTRQTFEGRTRCRPDDRYFDDRPF
jgi:hypothetical protein